MKEEGDLFEQRVIRCWWVMIALPKKGKERGGGREGGLIMQKPLLHNRKAVSPSQEIHDSFAVSLGSLCFFLFVFSFLSFFAFDFCARLLACELRCDLQSAASMASEQKASSLEGWTKQTDEWTASFTRLSLLAYSFIRCFDFCIAPFYD